MSAYDIMLPTSTEQADKRGEAAQNALNRVRFNASIDAAKRMYGDIFSDPTVAKQAQDYGQAEKMNPLAVTAQTEANTGAGLDNNQKSGDQKRMAVIRAAGMLAASAGPDGAVDPGAYDKLITPNAELLGIDPAHADAFKSVLTQPGGKAHLEELSQALLGPTQIAGALTYGKDKDGNPVAIGHDKYGRIIQQSLDGTVSTAQQNSDTSAAGQQTRAQQGWARVNQGQQNADTRTYGAGVTANNSVYGAPDGVALPQQGGAPQQAPPAFDEGTMAKFVSGAFPGATITSQQRSPEHNRAVGGVPTSQHLAGTAVDFVLPKGTSFADVQSTLAESGIPVTELINEGDHVHIGWGPKGQQAAPAAKPNPNDLFDRLPPKGKAQALGQAQQLVNQSQALDGASQIIKQVREQVSPYTTGPGALIHFPGTVQNDLQNNLKTLEAQGVTAIINSQKNLQGQTGQGRILQSEIDLWRSGFASLDPHQTAGQFATHLSIFEKRLNQLPASARAAFRQQFGRSPEKALGMPERGAPTQKYSDAQHAALKKYGL